MQQLCSADRAVFAANVLSHRIRERAGDDLQTGYVLRSVHALPHDHDASGDDLRRAGAVCSVHVISHRVREPVRCGADGRLFGRRGPGGRLFDVQCNLDSDLFPDDPNDDLFVSVGDDFVCRPDNDVFGAGDHLFGANDDLRRAYDATISPHDDLFAPSDHLFAAQQPRHNGPAVNVPKWTGPVELNDASGAAAAVADVARA